MPIDPGEHVIEASAPGKRTWKRTLTVPPASAASAGEKLAFTIPDLADAKAGAGATVAGSPSSADPASDNATSDGGWPSLAYIGFGMGAVGLATGSVAGFMHLSAVDDLESDCEGTICGPESQDDYDSAMTKAHIANIGFGIGIVGTALGVWSLLSQDEPTQTSHARRSNRFRVAVSPIPQRPGVSVQGEF